MSVWYIRTIVCTTCFIAASSAHPAEEPPSYAAFSKPLASGQAFLHALNRLTFGPRPGDLERITSVGLKRWLNQQLHPGKLPESPQLAERLEPLETIRLSVDQTLHQYPSPQIIAAVARGRSQLPTDPTSRQLLQRLADRYRQKHSAKDGTADRFQNIGNTEDLGPEASLQSFLTPDRIAILKTGQPEEKSQVLASIPPDRRADFAWALRPSQRQALLPFAPIELQRTLIMATRPQNVITSDLSEAKILRATYSTHQLEELLTDFWFNHFNVLINKGADHYLVAIYEREAIRPHVLGKFETLLIETAKSPAMLFYLDNWQSVSVEAAAQQARRNPNARRRGLNENYGRELLELHTLGVDGGYSQKDVIDVARCFTGWTIGNPRKGGAFEYKDKLHDKGQKTVLGHVIRAGGGMNDGLRVIEILAHHPSTAHFISLELAQRFVADNPPPSLVDRMAQTFLKTGGDLRAVTAAMVDSPEFWSEGAYKAKVKTPFEMVVSSLRAANANVSSAFSVARQLERLGEPLYRKVEPTGYSNANAEWISSAGLLDRMNFAMALTHNRVPGAKVNASTWQVVAAQDPMMLAGVLLAEDPSIQTRTAIQKMLSDPVLQQQLATSTEAGTPQIPSLIAGLVIGSPDFQRH